LVVRISDVINHVLRLEVLYGVVKASDVVKVTGLTDRIVRDYLNYLVELGILEYHGSGVYRVDQSRVSEVLSMLEPEPFTQLKLTDFVDQRFLQEYKISRQLTGKVSKIMDKLNFTLLFDGHKLRRKLSKLEPGYSGEVIGEKFIYPKSAKRILVDNVMVPGTASAYSIHNYGFEEYVVLTNIYLAASVYGAYYKGDVVDDSKSIKRIVPDLANFTGREPFEVGDPFYEISTDFPDILGVARNIAARYLSNLLHLKMDLWFLENYGDDIEILFKMGDLVPHGFIVSTRKLIELKDKVHDLFFKVTGLARKKGVLLASVTYHGHDNIFLKNVERVLGQKLAETNDSNFLSLVLSDGDTTTLIYRESEKGRPKVTNWYEFYIKYVKDVYRIDFIALNDPFEDYEKIRDIAYSTSILPPTRGLFTGPSCLATALIHAKTNVSMLERTISAVIKGSLIDQITKIQEKRDEERFRRAFNG
jgi:hypothetical protein